VGPAAKPSRQAGGPDSLPRAPGRPAEDEAQSEGSEREFRGLRQVIEHFEADGYVTMGQFVNSDWPASVVHEKTATDEIGVTLKMRGAHRFPQPGFHLRAVFLEDRRGNETVLVFRSVQKVQPMKPSGDLR
jgi:hypothetical protein